jgi:hypothetical protein
MSGEVPFSGIYDNIVMIMVGIRNTIPNRPVAQIPPTSAQGDTLWDLFCRCWDREPSNRPSAAEVKDIVSRYFWPGL